MKQSVSLVIFDLDNTLWDWVRVWGASFGAMLARIAADSGVAIETLKEEFHVIHQRHGTAEYAFSMEELPSLRAKHPDGNIAKIYDEAVRAYREERKRHLALYSDVMETLQTLKDRGCLLIGYTESMAFYSAQRLRRTGLDRVVDYLYSPPDHDLPQNMTPEQIRRYPAETYKLRRTVHRHTPKGELKPNPKILGDIIQAVGGVKEETIYIGDSEMKDIAMAKAGGVTDVWAKYGTSAQDTPDYELLREVTHWTPEMVTREAKLRERTSSDQLTATYTLGTGFGELLKLFDFKDFTHPSQENLSTALDAWKTTVDVQQHFNDIEMRIRNFAVTLFTAVLAAAAVAHDRGLEVAIGLRQIPVAAIICAAGAGAWLLFYFMEAYWYHVFLRAASVHADFIETRWGKRFPELGLSKRIGAASNAVRLPSWPKWLSNLVGVNVKSTGRIRLFYVAGFSILLLAGWSSGYIHQSKSSAPLPQANSQQVQQTPVTTANSPATSTPSPTDNWSRTKDCAAQADRMAARAKLDTDKAVLGRQNHYSPRDDNCYMQISYVNAEARANHDLPLMYDELWDAFEGRLLSTCTDSTVSGKGAFCNIQRDRQGLVDCSVCRLFIEDRMNN